MQKHLKLKKNRPKRRHLGPRLGTELGKAPQNENFRYYFFETYMARQFRCQAYKKNLYGWEKNIIRATYVSKIEARCSRFSGNFQNQDQNQVLFF